MHIMTEIQENNLNIMNRIQEDENNLDELQKSIKEEEQFKLDEMDSVAKGLRDVEQALQATKNREKQMYSNMPVRVPENNWWEKYFYDDSKEWTKIIANKQKFSNSKSKFT